MLKESISEVGVLFSPCSDKKTDENRSRLLICGVTILVCIICYGDRAALSVAMPSIVEEFGLTPGETGWILSSFLWSYFLLNLPSAVFLDRVGPRLAGIIAVVLWSFAMVLGGVVATIPAFIATRILLGMGEAPIFPLGSKVMRYWARPDERGFMMTAFICGIPIGLASGAVICAWLVQKMGWRPAFIFLGCFGLIWSVIWFFVYPARKKNQENIVSPGCGKKNPGILNGISISKVFRNRSFWGVVIPQCCGNYANFLLMSWLPTILRDTFHVSVIQSGLYMAYSYIGATVLSLMMGRLGESIVSKNKVLFFSRRKVVSVFLLMAMVLVVFPFCHSLWIAVAVLIISIASVTAGMGANMALLADLLVEHECLGAVTGLALTFSNGLGIIAPVLTGYLLQKTGNFYAVFYSTAAIVVIGSVTAKFMPYSKIYAYKEVEL